MSIGLMIFLVFTISIVAAIVQRTTGFGYGIIVMLFFPYLFGSHGEATAISGIVSICACSCVSFQYRKNILWRQVFIMIIPYIAAMLFAVWVAATQPQEMLKKLLGITFIIFSIYFVFFNNKIKMRPTVLNGSIAGGLSGILGGLFATGGPPLAVYLSSATESYGKETYIATIQAFFVFSNLSASIARATSGFFTLDVIKSLPIAIAGMALGTFIGSKIFNRLNPQMIKYAVAAVMMLSGVLMIVPK